MKITIRKIGDCCYVYTLVARNGKVMAESIDAYGTEAKAKRSALHLARAIWRDGINIKDDSK